MPEYPYKLMAGFQGRCCATVVLLLVLLFPVLSQAEADNNRVVVIGHSDIGVDVLSQQAIRDLYLGKTVQLATGVRVEIIDLPQGHPVRKLFYTEVIGREPGQMRAYWAKRIFTGKGRPPETLVSERSVINWVASKAGRIGYVSADAADDSVKVLFDSRLVADTE